MIRSILGIAVLALGVGLAATVQAQVKTAEAEYNFSAVVMPGGGVAMVAVDQAANGPGAAQAFFRDYFGLRPRDAKRALPKVVLKFSDNDDFDSIATAVKSLQISPKIVVELEHSTSATRLIVSRDLPGATNVKPNPLSLLVEADAQNNVTLNGEAMGRTSDLGKLTGLLKRIYADREKNGVLRENTNEIEKTIFVRMSPRASGAELMMVAGALKDAGADRIGLQTEYPIIRENILNVQATPSKRP